MSIVSSDKLAVDFAIALTAIGYHYFVLVFLPLRIDLGSAMSAKVESWFVFLFRHFASQ